MDEAFGLPNRRVLAGHRGEEAEMPVETPGDKEPIRSSDVGGQHLPQLAPGIV